MSVTFSPAADYAAFDGTETVTFSVIADGVVASTQTCAGALRRALGKAAAALSGRGMYLEQGDLVWHLPTANLGSVVPKLGDSITDAASAVWNVLSISRDTLGTRWRCITRLQRT